MASDKEEKQEQRRPVYLKAAALALAVGIVEAVVAGFAASTTRFSVGEFAFAFILTYTIVAGIFSKGGPI